VSVTLVDLLSLAVVLFVDLLICARGFLIALLVFAVTLASVTFGRNLGVGFQRGDCVEVHVPIASHPFQAPQYRCHVRHCRPGTSSRKTHTIRTSPGLPRSVRPNVRSPGTDTPRGPYRTSLRRPAQHLPIQRYVGWSRKKMRVCFDSIRFRVSRDGARYGPGNRLPGTMRVLSSNVPFVWYPTNHCSSLEPAVGSFQYCTVSCRLDRISAWPGLAKILSTLDSPNAFAFFHSLGTFFFLVCRTPLEIPIPSTARSVSRNQPHSPFLYDCSHIHTHTSLQHLCFRTDPGPFSYQRLGP
jgi:hypothetical protein